MKRLFYLFVLAVCCACAPKTPGLVKVEGGWIQGEVSENLIAYKGIPFAAPPVGDLRWKAPQPAAKWDGVLDATQYGPDPMQGNGTDPKCSEDCLHLNVWAPVQPKDKKLPVLVWIYGGGFSGGSTAQYGKGCERLAAKSDGSVIVASINYRVGIFGFFCHPELDAESPSHTSGNYGILDQIAGLQWIQRNIAKFGGDPDRVTIFGESAGGISVSMLCASPLAKGLFRGAISQSGGSFGPVGKVPSAGENMVSLAVAEQNGVAFAERLGAASLADLRAMDAATLQQQRGYRGWPVADGYVIPGDQYKLYSEGKYNDVDVLIGYNSDEGASFGGARDAEAFRASTRARYEQFADELMAAYPLDPDGRVGLRARGLTRDAAFGWQTWAWARLQKQTGKGNVYLYYFDQHPEYPEDSDRYGHGSHHGEDIAFIFQSIEPKHEFARQPESDWALADAMARYWFNFAATGDPNKPDEGLPEWPQFDPENPQVMVLTGPTPFVGPVPDEEGLWALDRYFAFRRSQE